MTSTDAALVYATIGLIVATLLSPFFAVRAQKWLDELHEKKQRKLRIFETLMATRASRLAPNHVMALNSISLNFNGKSAFEKAVMEAWKIYFDHLDNPLPSNLDPQIWKQKQDAWIEKSNELFVKLLKALSDSLGYGFDEVELNRGFYAPVAHAEIETFNQLTRTAITNIILKNAPIPMSVTNFPASDEATLKLQTALLNLLEGDKPIKVSIAEMPDKS
jgi:hypothetical protein